MELISIENLKKLCNLKTSSNENYYFQSFNSSHLKSNTQLRVKGIICLHHRNYKLILVDKTDWIYLEFLDCSSSLNKSFIKVNYLLKEITIDVFNIFIENLLIHQSNSETLNKKIYYLQSDLVKCSIDFHTQITDDKQISLSKTFALNKIFQVESTISSVVDETFDESKEEFLFELNDLEMKNAHFYLFKIITKSSIFQMNDTQFKSKLRADFQIELVPCSNNETDLLQNKYFILSLSSKYLFYYNFLHVNSFYLLKSMYKIDFNMNESQQRLTNSGIFFMNENMFIIDHFSFVDKQNYLNLIEKFNMNSTRITNSNDNFKLNLTGVLVSKRVKTIQIMNTQSSSLISYYDILIPFQEVILSIRVDNELITVYFDTKHSLYPLCVLPGMQINILNLIKKSTNVYKSNSFVCPTYAQESCILSDSIHLNETKKEKSIVDHLNEINFTFDNFYSKFNEEISNETELDRKSLLFGNENLRLVAQVVRVYDLSIRLKCSNCNLLFNSCSCTTKPTNSRVEMNASFLVDDHTSLIKLTYSDLNYDFKYHQSNMFTPIFEFLNSILTKYFNEIKLENIPIQLNTFESELGDDLNSYYRNLNRKITDDIKQRVKASVDSSATNETTISSSCDTTTSLNDLDNFFENNVKIDLYKTLYDYLTNCFIEKYFLFVVENTNEMLLKKINAKSEYCLFKLSENKSNEQYKSILTCKCYDFYSIDKFIS